MALALGLGGVVMFVGGELHPRDLQDSVDETLANYFASSTWTVSHLLILVGLLTAVGGLLLARRVGLVPAEVRPWLTGTAVAWGLASIELVPHVLADRDLEHLEHGGATPILDTHLLLGAFASPLVGLGAATLAVAIARSARTWPARLLAVPAVVGGVAYAMAGPAILLTDDVAFAPLFAGQNLVAVWLVGTALRLGLARPATAAGGVRPDESDPAEVAAPAEPMALV
ncbi:hypothetical protein [Iamia sp. SCSIO 61187]|uniref:hypothetical protein n=1 Tax=Iamia sp. SCSIO 61187 TaxID=2722752 RepID=UPI001C62602F|nr:hypothetical protein [Iamia sp. SCSIO 61187]